MGVDALLIDIILYFMSLSFFLFFFFGGGGGGTCPKYLAPSKFCTLKVEPILHPKTIKKKNPYSTLQNSQHPTQQIRFIVKSLFHVPANGPWNLCPKYFARRNFVHWRLSQFYTQNYKKNPHYVQAKPATTFPIFPIFFFCFYFLFQCTYTHSDTQNNIITKS